MSKLIIIDADFLPFICSKDTISESVDNIDSIINTILEKTGATRYILCVSSSPYFRKKYNPTYKANRGPSNLKWLSTLKGYMKDKHKAFSINGLEADDLCLIIESLEKESIVCSRDKDILYQCTSPYNFYKHEFLPKNTASDKIKFISKQVLLGDRVDNIPPFKKGWGEVGVTKYLNALSDTNYLVEILKLYNETYAEEGMDKFYKQYKQVKILSSVLEAKMEFGDSFEVNYSENIIESRQGDDSNDRTSILNFTD